MACLANIVRSLFSFSTIENYIILLVRNEELTACYVTSQFGFLFILLDLVLTTHSLSCATLCPVAVFLLVLGALGVSALDTCFWLSGM